MRVTIRTLLIGSFVLALVGTLFALTVARGQTTLSTNVTVGDTTHIAGTLSKGSGTFIIDHPLDPENKLLYHSFVESPDAKNIYDGVITLNKKGEATIELPDYFTALNSDFRYLASAIGEPMPNLHLKQGVTVKKQFFGLKKRYGFVISGGTPGGEISWQVTGVRKDLFILARPIITEVPKGNEQLVDVGECLFKPLCF